MPGPRRSLQLRPPRLRAGLSSRRPGGVRGEAGPRGARGAPRRGGGAAAAARRARPAQARRGRRREPALGRRVSRRRGDVRASARDAARRGALEDGDRSAAVAAARDRNPPLPGADRHRPFARVAPRRPRMARGPGGAPGGGSWLRPPGGARLRTHSQTHRAAARAGGGSAGPIDRRDLRDHAPRNAAGEPARPAPLDGSPPRPGEAVMDPLLEQLLAGFVDESQEIYERVTRTLMELEKSPAQGPGFDDLARGLHTLKGSAATLGLEELADFAHRMEDVILPLRGSAKPLPAAVADAVLKSLDVWMPRLRPIPAKGELPDLQPSFALLEKGKPAGPAQ